jgi:hypothetical protein
MSSDVLSTAEIDASPLKTVDPTATMQPALPALESPDASTAKPLPGGSALTNDMILKELNDLKTLVNDGFAKISTKISEIGMKQKGGRNTRKRHARRSKKRVYK